MAEDIRISTDGAYILVTSVGPPSLREMEQTLSRLSELRLKYGIGKVLVDSRARSDQPLVTDIYDGGQLLAQTLRHGARIAVLVNRIEEDHQLLEDVAVNRGAFIAFFQDEQLALSWLLKE